MKTIGKYRIHGLLGKGGMGKVYKVQIPVIDKIVALKYLAPHHHLVHVLGNEKIKQLFQQEAVIMAGIRHRYVASVLDFGEIDGHAFYIMEYHSHNLGAFIGESYRAEAPSRPLPVDKTIEYTNQILSGLARLHLEGIVHRDLKPYNILIDDEEEVKICDFGLSRLRGESVRIPSQLKIGSPFYTAPEQESCPDEAGPPADLYSVGIMVYRMLTGTLPKKRLIPVHRFNSDLDPKWDVFMKRSLALSPKIRFQSADKMADALNDLAIQWEDKKEAVCRWLEPDLPPRVPVRKKLRSQPEKISSDLARKSFDLDSRWRPKRYGKKIFVHSNDKETVFDPQTSLLWIKRGWPYCVTWQEAMDIVDRMNKEAFGGVQAWRIPTIPEIISIMHAPLKVGDLCLAPDFDPRHRWLWSSDRCTLIAHWYVNMDLGYVGNQDKTAHLYVKAVASVGQRKAVEILK